MDVVEGHLGVHFHGGPQVGARAVLWVRSAIRVMEELAVADDVRSADDLYAFAREDIDWRRLIAKESQTISVQAVVGAGRAQHSGRMRPGDWECPECSELVFASKQSCFACGAPRPAVESTLTHSHFTALTIKNAACDALRDEVGWRPSVDTADADLPLSLYLHRGQATLYRVCSGATSMHKRGYRTGAIHAGALKESIAAGLLLHAGYDPEQHTLCDPMAGSGTFPIEAALIATDTAPGLLRPTPPIGRRGWLDWGDVDWPSLQAEARDLRRPMARRSILANDVHGGALSLARRGAEAAGVADCIQFSQCGVASYVPPDQPQLIVSNPPWDQRIEGGAEAWRDLGSFLKRECGGASAFLLSGNKALTQHVRMRSASKLRIEQAGDTLAFIKYDVLPPKGSGIPLKGYEIPRQGPELPTKGTYERASPDESPVDSHPGATRTPTQASPANADLLGQHTDPTDPTGSAEQEGSEDGLEEGADVSVRGEAVRGSATTSSAAAAAATAAATAAAVAAAAAVGGEGESSTVQVVDSSGKQADELDDFFSSLYD
jgi:putative N6-adenine-specific DNA methylase